MSKDATGSGVFCFDGATGLELWSYTIEDSSAFKPVSLDDLSGDGTPDVVFAAANPVDAFDGPTERPLWESAVPGVHQIYCEPALGDLTGDGVADAAFHTSQSKEVIALDGKDGRLLWRIPTGAENKRGVAIADLDGDLRPEVIAPSLDGFIYFLRAGGEVYWKAPIGPGGSRAPPGLADRTGDGFPEIMVGGTDGTLHVLDPRARTSFATIEHAAGAMGHAVAVAAPEGRGNWILAPTATGEGLVALSWPDGALRWQFAKGPNVLATPRVADLDGDGLLEIVVAGFDGRVHVVSGLSTRAARRPAE